MRFEHRCYRLATGQGGAPMRGGGPAFFFRSEGGHPPLPSWHPWSPPLDMGMGIMAGERWTRSWEFLSMRSWARSTIQGSFVRERTC